MLLDPCGAWNVCAKRLDDLADLATDELSEITGQSPDEATALIMKARAHWFTGEAGEAQS